MRMSLARDTAQLPYIDGRFRGPATRTADAIVTGCLHAQLGAIERMFRLVAHEPGDAVSRSTAARAPVLRRGSNAR